ncbi:tol-pal system YbgF family protein, partial [Candidatus Latescibacterota bacterium]
RNPYEGPGFALAARRETEVVEEATAWASGDPVVVAAEAAVRGQYRPPVEIAPPQVAPPSREAALDDPRLPPVLTSTVRELWGKDILDADHGKMALSLPRQLAAKSTGLSGRTSDLAMASLQRRWRWSPGARQEKLVATAGITSMAGGLQVARPGPAAVDVRSLEGYEGLYADLASLDSLWHDEYGSLLQVAADGAVKAAELSTFAAAHPGGPWAAQIKVLEGRALLREGRLAAADSLFAAMWPRWEDTVWGDDVLIGRLATAQKRGAAGAAEQRHADMVERFPDSEWVDDGLFMLARTYQDAGRVREAMRIFAQFPAGFPTSIWTEEAVYQASPAAYLKHMNRVTGAVFDPETRQLVLTGERDADLPRVDMDDLVVALRAIYLHREDPAVSIGTEASGVEGYKQVRYDGGTANTSFGMTMFRADYALKTLSIGLDSTLTPVTPDLPDYRSAIDWSMELDPLALGVTWNSRVWFVPDEMRVRTMPDGQGIVFEEVPIVVLSDSRFGRRRVTQQGPERFAAYLSEHFDLLADQYESIRKLPEMAKLVAIAKWMREERIPVDLAWMVDYQTTAVATPTLVRAATAEREKRTGDTVWDMLKLTLEGGVSFREPNVYEPLEEGQVEAPQQAMRERPPSDVDLPVTGGGGTGGTRRGHAPVRCPSAGQPDHGPC